MLGASPGLFSSPTLTLPPLGGGNNRKLARWDGGNDRKPTRWGEGSDRVEHGNITFNLS